MLTCSSLGNQSRLKALRCFFARLFSLIVRGVTPRGRSLPELFAVLRISSSYPSRLLAPLGGWASHVQIQIQRHWCQIEIHRRTQKRKYRTTSLHSCWQLAPPVLRLRLVEQVIYKYKYKYKTMMPNTNAKTVMQIQIHRRTHKHKYWAATLHGCCHWGCLSRSCWDPFVVHSVLN